MQTVINDSVAMPVPAGRAGLRERARHADALTTSEIPLARVWTQLVEGDCTIVDSFFSAERCYLLLQTRIHRARVLHGRRLKIIESTLSGVSQKVISLDMNLAASSVALNARAALNALGIPSRPSQAHPLLMLAARAARDHDSARVALLSVLDERSPGLRTVSIARPDVALAERISPAEVSVLRGLVEGCSHAEIARRRGTSTRTIANQVASVFQRLAVSGRNELVHLAFALAPPPSEIPACGRRAWRSSPPHPERKWAQLRRPHLSGYSQRGHWQSGRSTTSGWKSAKRGQGATGSGNGSSVDRKSA